MFLWIYCSCLALDGSQTASICLVANAVSASVAIMVTGVKKHQNLFEKQQSALCLSGSSHPPKHCVVSHTLFSFSKMISPHYLLQGRKGRKLAILHSN